MKIIVEHVEYTARRSRMNPLDKTRIWKLEIKPQPGLLEFESKLNKLMLQDDMSFEVDIIIPDKAKR